MLKKGILENNLTMEEADLDGFETVDALDFLLMKRYLTGQISEFAAVKI